MPTATANMGFKMEWDEFLKLYAKRNRGSLTTTPGQSTLTYIFSPQDIRDAIRAPHSPESRQPSPSGQYVMPSPTYGYAPSTGSSCSGVLSPFYLSSPTDSVRSTTSAWRPESQDYTLSPSPSFSRSSSPPSSPSFSASSWRTESQHYTLSSSPYSSPPSPALSWDTSQGSYSPSPSPNRLIRNTHKRVYQKRAKVQGEVYLPLGPQTRLLSKIQTLLEHACFTYAEKHLPQLLDENDWDCPEAGELNVWMHHLAIHGLELHYLARDRGITERLSSVMHSVENIRHDAVHRNRVEISRLAIYLDHAVDLCTVLGDQEDLNKLKAIRDETKAQIAPLQAAVLEAGKNIAKFYEAR
ncbi:hypothetical protein EDB82DRAFT_561984 [Fusarium venenatum]|uniref:uncharacterized protein n=1 Tax=Fusarium venenatum TaxID=56646 RepID=UPI001D8ABC40|nr:hypothetical protein EDB82DRAFT_561984 [Fusarium venenatum]